MNWKVYKDFTNWISINETEIEKAIFAFITGNPVVFSNGGAIRHIESIMPDWNGTMGWNEGYKLGPEDWAIIHSKGADRKIQLYFENAKQKVEYLMRTNQTNLIGKNVEIPEIENDGEYDIKQLTSKLANDKRM